MPFGLGLLFGALCLAAPAPAEERKVEALVVGGLVRQLDSDAPEERDQAEESLEKLGPDALAFIPDLDSDRISAEQRRRLRRLLPKLWQARLHAQVQGSVVTLDNPSIPLDELLATIQKQTGNQVTDLRRQFNQEPANPTIKLSAPSLRFWEALDQVTAQSGLGYYFFTDDRSIGLTGTALLRPPTAYAGAFRATVQRLDLDRDYTGEIPMPVCSTRLEILVEPRLQPIMLEVRTADVSIKDDLGNSLAVMGPKEFSLSIEAGVYHFPLLLRTPAPPRAAKTIAELKGELGVWLPANVEEFAFGDLGVGRQSGQSKSGLKVDVGPIGVEDGVWTVPVETAVLTENRPVDSHLQAALEPTIYLRHKGDKIRFEQNGGLSTIFEEPQRSKVEYLFVDAPGAVGDYEVVVRLPVGLTRTPVKFEFKDLELP